MPQFNWILLGKTYRPVKDILRLCQLAPLPLIMIDDVLAISSCGNNSAIVQIKIDTKQLVFGPKKCFKLHIGNTCKSRCPTLQINDQVMTTVEKEKYLGYIFSNDGKININNHE